jgi:hypothetical protein
MTRSTFERIRDSLNEARKSWYFWLGAGVVVPTWFLAMDLIGNFQPRRPTYGALTIPEAAQKIKFNTIDNMDDEFDEDKTVRGHLEKLAENIDDFDDFRLDVWKYTQFWYGPKSDGIDIEKTGDGMDSYEDIVKGKPGSCTEGSVAFYANMSRLVEVPGTGEKLDHYILLVTYEKSDMSNSAGHALYVGKITSHEGKERFFVGGINPFENPLKEYDSVEDLLEHNTDLFREYAWKGLTKRGVMIRPQKFALINPEEDLGLDVVSYSDKVMNVKDPERDSRDSVAVHIQRKFNGYFDSHAVEYFRPGSTAPEKEAEKEKEVKK